MGTFEFKFSVLVLWPHSNSTVAALALNSEDFKLTECYASLQP